MKLNAELIDESLSLLATLIEGEPPLHFIICGGSSLLALGMVKRDTTRDVDILAMMDQGEVCSAKPLPAYLEIAAAQVSRELHLMDDWLNTGPSDDSFFRFGLPEGIADRLVTREYGISLTISYISRFDQIHLKLYAAVDNGPHASRHSQDLLDLNPTDEELKLAITWCLLHDDSAGFQMNLKLTLTNLEYADVAQSL